MKKIIFIVIIIISLTVNVYAAYPSLPYVQGYSYFMLTDDPGSSGWRNQLWVSDRPLIHHYNNGLTFSINELTNIKRYELIDGSWQHKSGYDYSVSNYKIYYSGNILMSNYDVKNYDGSVFFFATGAPLQNPIIQPLRQNLQLPLRAVIVAATIVVSSILLLVGLRTLVPVLRTCLKRLVKA